LKDLPVSQTDYHVHTAYCHHATGEMEAYVLRAIQLGFTEIGFSDHAPVRDLYDPEHRMKWNQFSIYVDTIQGLRESYPQIQILLGIEADVYNGFESSLIELKGTFPIDYVIGSVHFIEGVPVFMYEAEPLSDDEIRAFITEYFDRLIRGVRSGLFDVIAHVDVIKWNYPDRTDFIQTQAERLFQEIQKTGLAIELNTSGLRKKPGETYPGLNLIRLAGQYKIPIITGSDAHEPKHVGADFHLAKELLQKAGYTTCFRFRPALLAYRV